MYKLGCSSIIMSVSTRDTLQNEIIGSFLSEKLPAQDDFRTVYIDSDGLPYEYTLSVWGPTSLAGAMC